MLRTIADAGQDDQTHHDCTRQFANRPHWLRDQRGLSFSGCEALRQWSVRDIDAARTSAIVRMLAIASCGSSPETERRIAGAMATGSPAVRATIDIDRDCS